MSPTICTITLCNDFLNETLYFVNHHLNIGIDHMFLFFDDPSDPAIDKLKGMDRLTCFECTPDFWKEISGKTDPDFMSRLGISGDYGVDLARQSGFDWAIRIDTDELIYEKQSLKQILAETPADIDCVNFQVLEALPESVHNENFFDEIKLYKVFYRSVNYNFKVKLSTRMKLHLSRVLFNIRKLFAMLSGSEYLKNERYFNGHIEGKTAFRTSSNITATESHFPVSEASAKLTLDYSRDCYILHFESCNYKTWDYKWMRRYKGSALNATINETRQKVMNKFIELTNKQDNKGLEQLYKSLYLMSSQDKKILLNHGMLKKLK